MEGYLVFDTFKGRTVNVYHTESYLATFDAREELEAAAVGRVTVLHLSTVTSWEAVVKRGIKKPTIDRLWRERLKREGSENGKGTEEVQSSKT